MESRFIGLHSTDFKLILINVANICAILPRDREGSRILMIDKQEIVVREDAAEIGKLINGFLP